MSKRKKVILGANLYPRGIVYEDNSIMLNLSLGMEGMDSGKQKPNMRYNGRDNVSVEYYNKINNILIATVYRLFNNEIKQRYYEIEFHPPISSSNIIVDNYMCIPSKIRKILKENNYDVQE